MKTDIRAYFLVAIGLTAVLAPVPTNSQMGDIARPIESKELKCLVCKASMAEMELAASKVDRHKKVEVGDYRLDTTGESKKKKKILYAKSEMFLTEMMESVCDRMDDYAKARYKKTGRPVVLKMMTEGGMNPEMSNVNFVQEGDLNKTLKHLCLEVVEDYDEEIIRMFQEDVVKDTDIRLCSQVANYCRDQPVDEEYEYEQGEEEREEL
ncbi:protein seele [Anopheles cruzii]|uniref:protein seele n=1 Tax=Anopheles cruzii TaxID=68878 RepID=UPI0022EC9618|nr:protein seele [Anopheles cruzii]